MYKVALVTGGGSGIGRDTALAFAQSGNKVVVADTDIIAGEETAHLISGRGTEVIFLKTDVTNSDDVQKLINTTVKTYGQLDYAFNNAGIAPPGLPIAEYSEQQWNSILAVNLTGVWLCMKYECAQMLKQNKGAIVNVSSIRALAARAASSAYCASKAGVIGLTKSVALDYAKRGIRVNAVCPGGIHTPLTEDAAVKQLMAGFVDAVPMGRLGDGSEISDTVLWLCSEQSSYITGQIITVDGGFTV